VSWELLLEKEREREETITPLEVSDMVGREEGRGRQRERERLTHCSCEEGDRVWC